MNRGCSRGMAPAPTAPGAPLQLSGFDDEFAASRVSSGVGEGRILAVPSNDPSCTREAGLSSGAAGERGEVHALAVDHIGRSLHEKDSPCRSPRWRSLDPWAGST